MEDLKKEFQIFKILLLKNFSSQKHFNHFQKFSKVKRIAQKLIDIDLPTEQDISTSKTLSNLMDKFKLTLNLKSAVLDSYNATRIQAQNAWFLPLNLTFMALLASIYCITNECF